MSQILQYSIASVTVKESDDDPTIGGIVEK